MVDRPSAATAVTPADARRRRLHYRCWHRGMREADLVLGRFADARLASLSEAGMAELEALLDVPDPELFAWICEASAAPARFETALLAAIRAFHAAEPAARDGGRW